MTIYIKTGGRYVVACASSPLPDYYALAIFAYISSITDCANEHLLVFTLLDRLTIFGITV